jgi:hypothetical protein
MTELIEIASELARPFDLAEIELLPKNITDKDGKTFCMVLPFADVRVYQDRLNMLACGEWSTPPPIALVVGQKLVNYVTITLCGVPHTDVGEAGPGENQATEAYAQAFKRACAQFGLGRYLYELPKLWVPYNKAKKQVDLDREGIQNVVRQMYTKAGVVIPSAGRRAS